MDKRYERVNIPDALISKVITDQHGHLINVIKKQGTLSYASYHEGLGVITEEYYELVDAIRENKSLTIKMELRDVVTTCLWAIASIEASEGVENG